MADSAPHPSRRQIIKAAGGAAVAASLITGAMTTTGPALAAPAGGRKLRYAIIGTGIRANRMWGGPVAKDFADVVEFVGLCDVNPKRALAAREMWGLASCPTFTDFDEMCDKTKPDAVMVCTVDAVHHEYIINALRRG